MSTKPLRLRILGRLVRLFPLRRTISDIFPPVRASSVVKYSRSNSASASAIDILLSCRLARWQRSRRRNNWRRSNCFARLVTQGFGVDSRHSRAYFVALGSAWSHAAGDRHAGSRDTGLHRHPYPVFILIDAVRDSARNRGIVHIGRRRGP